MANNINILKILRLLVLIPAMVMLFACSGLDETSSATKLPGAEENEDVLEMRQRECWQAHVVGAIYDTAGKLAMNMYNHITKGAMAFMMIAFALWLAFRLMKHISSFTEESPAEVWTEITRKLFICFVCGLLASSPQGSLFILNSVLFPVYNAFLELGGEIVSRAAEDPTLAKYRNQLGDAALWSGKAGTILDAQRDIVCSVQAINKSVSSFYGDQPVTVWMDAATLETFPKSPQLMMECMVCSVNERLNFGYKLGWKILQAKGFMALICGLIVMIIFTFVKLGFVFYLVDSVFRFAMMVLILPLLIMSFAFKATKKWAITGFLTILNSGAFMMCIAIVMFMCLATIQQILYDNLEMFDFWSLGTGAESFADFSGTFLMLLLLCFLLVASIGIAKTIADTLVGGGGNANFQKRVAKAFKMFAKAVVVKATAGIGAFALRNSKRLRQMNKMRKSMKGKLNGLAGIGGAAGMPGGGDEEEGGEGGGDEGLLEGGTGGGEGGE